MQLKLFRHLWGMQGGIDVLFRQIKAAGYIGVEAGLPPLPQREQFAAELKVHNLEFIGMIFSEGNDVAGHIASFETQLQEIKAFKPAKVTAHSGRDEFDLNQARAFVQAALKIEKQIGVTVGHETHRGRIFFNPWITRDLLAEFTDLKLTCDFSHWCVVAERMTWDRKCPIGLYADRCIHLHSRVGYEQGPQVPDPAAPEYAAHLAISEGWWEQIWKSQQARGVRESTLTPEFGPPGYLHTLPYTNVPVADLVSVCDGMAERELRRFNEMFSRSG